MIYVDEKKVLLKINKRVVFNKAMYLGRKKNEKKNKSCSTIIRDFRVNMHNGDKNIYT